MVNDVASCQRPGLHDDVFLENVTLLHFNCSFTRQHHVRFVKMEQYENGLQSGSDTVSSVKKVRDYTWVAVNYHTRVLLFTHAGGWVITAIFPFRHHICWILFKKQVLIFKLVGVQNVHDCYFHQVAKHQCLSTLRSEQTCCSEL